MKRLWRWLFGVKCKNCDGTGDIVVWDDIEYIETECFGELTIHQSMVLPVTVYTCPICKGRGRVR